LSLENTMAVVYGAAGHLGSAVARALARERAFVFLADRSPDAVNTLEHLIAEEGGVAEATPVDVLDPASVQEYSADIAAWSGGIDIALSVLDTDHLPHIDPANRTGRPPAERLSAAERAIARASIAQMAARHSGLIVLITREILINSELDSLVHEADSHGIRLHLIPRSRFSPATSAPHHRRKFRHPLVPAAALDEFAREVVSWTARLAAGTRTEPVTDSPLE
jgi:NAD(P)-dependent dehydrogenase (short-subunit alcohol dehydrogenase family)